MGPILSEHTRTNASNPTTINQLDDAFKALKKAENTAVSDKPLAPRKHMPAITQIYRRMGEALEMCPYEIQAIFEHEFDTDNVLIRETLKKFLATMKLSGEVDLTPTRKMLKDVDDQYEKRLTEWEKLCERAEIANADREESIRKAEKDFGQAWGRIIIDLIQKVDKNSDIESLGRIDKWMIKALAETDTKAANIDKNGLVNLNFQALKKMKPEVIVSIPDLAQRLYQEDYEIQYVKWLCKAPLNEITSAMTSSSTSDESEFFHTVLMARKGLKPIKDQWNNWQWIEAGDVEQMADDLINDPETSWYGDGYPRDVMRMVKLDASDIIHYAYRDFCESKRHPF